MYDGILGMDWKDTHIKSISRKHQKLLFWDSTRNATSILGENGKPHIQLVTLTNLAKGMRKKQLVYDIPLSPISWSQVQSRTKWLNAYYYIFSEELTQFSPKCKVDYDIELIPSAQLISKKIYKILALKSIELKDYLT